MDNPYLITKLIHIISSVLMVGTGFGSAFYLFFTNMRKNVEAIKEVSKLVVYADYIFTFPTVIIQPISGYYMMHLAGYTFDHLWLKYALILYIIAGLSWLPVVWLQIEMSKMAAASTTVLPARYWRFAKYWTMLGFVGFGSVVGIFILMVLKPSF